MNYVKIYIKSIKNSLETNNKKFKQYKAIKKIDF